MVHTYGDALSFFVKFKLKKQNKELTIDEASNNAFVWFVANDKDGNRVLSREQKSQAFEFDYEETKKLYPGEYSCSCGIRYGDEGHYKYQTKNQFTLTVVKGDRVPVPELREVW